MKPMIRWLGALGILFLAACGFTPMYGSSGGAVQGLDKIEIPLIRDQSGVYLRNLLIDQFYQNGYPQNPDYVLSIDKIHETKTDLDITVDSEATRRQLDIDITMVLHDKATGATLLKRDLSTITTYNILGSQFTTRVSENDAREAALEDIARQIENQLVLYLKH